MSGRQESEFKVLQPDGTTKIYTLVPFVTADDLMELAAQAVAGEIKLGVPYESPSSRGVRDQLIVINVTSRS